jgi:hypothetical protein
MWIEVNVMQGQGMGMSFNTETPRDTQRADSKQAIKGEREVAGSSQRSFALMSGSEGR